MRNVVVLDPSIGSGNLGDSIIARAALEGIEEAFSGHRITRVALHQPLGRPGRRLVGAADLVVFAGTNLLGPQIWLRRQFKAELHTLLRARRSIVLYGSGRNTTAQRPDVISRALYRRILSPVFVHSVRDQQACRFLQAAGVTNVLVTGCPTTSRVQTRSRDLVVRNAAALSNRSGSSAIVAFTDYAPDVARDSVFLESLAGLGVRQVLFWPQGPGDAKYVSQVAAKAKLRNWSWLPPDLGSLGRALDEPGVALFAGTRLHCAMFCIEHGVPAVLLPVDNRVLDFASTFPLMTVEPGREPLTADLVAGFYDARWHGATSLDDRCGKWLRETRALLDAQRDHS